MDSKSPLKGLKLYAEILALGYGLFSQSLAVADVRFNILLQRKSDAYFVIFDLSEWVDAAQENSCATRSRTPAPSRGESKSPNAGSMNLPDAVTFHQQIEWSSIDHSDLNLKSVNRGRAIPTVGFINGHAPFAIKETREVDVVLSVIHRGSEQKVRELGGHPMPGPIQGAEGQSRTKHRGESLEGVCREQVRTPKGKVCSELGGNIESETETISSCVAITIPHRVTERYLRTCNAPVRFVRPGGQGGTADVTWESLEYMGRPWYWDQMVPQAMAA